MPTEAERRALRAKLHAKLRAARSAPSTLRSPPDPISALLAVGVDDASLLKSAAAMAERPHEAIHMLKKAIKDSTQEDSEEEEAPPS